MSENAGENRFSVPTGLAKSRYVPMGPGRYNFGGGSLGAIVSCRDQDGGSKRSYRDLSGWLSLVRVRVKKLLSFTQFWSGQNCRMDRTAY